MDLSAPKARVNGAQMSQNVGRLVRLVCKQEGVTGNTMTVKTADGQVVTVQLKGGGNYNTEYLEFEGIVENATTLSEQTHTDFGNNFDLGTYNEVCKLSNNEHRNLFLPTSL